MRVILILLFLLPTLVSAKGVDYNQINFNVKVDRVVKNDLLKIDFYVSEQGKNTASIANEINKKIKLGLGIAKKYPQIEVSTGNYYINPQYKKSKIVNWHGRQDVHIQSKDMQSLTELTQKLQAIFNISESQFLISKELEKKTKGELILELFEKFKNKADLFVQQLDAKDYKIVQLNIGAQQESYSPMRYESLTRSSSTVSNSANFVAGKGEIQSSLSATIELFFE